MRAEIFLSEMFKHASVDEALHECAAVLRQTKRRQPLVANPLMAHLTVRQRLNTPRDTQTLTRRYTPSIIPWMCYGTEARPATAATRCRPTCGTSHHTQRQTDTHRHKQVDIHRHTEIQRQVQVNKHREIDRHTQVTIHQGLQMQQTDRRKLTHWLQPTFHQIITTFHVIGLYHKDEIFQ